MATPHDLDSILKRIAKLSELTLDRGATQAEAEQAAVMIQKLLDKYSLSMDQVSPIKNRTKSDVNIEDYIRTNSRLFDWEVKLADVIMIATSTYYVYWREKITFIGVGKDAQIARELYTQFHAIAQHCAKIATATYAGQFFDPRTLRGPYSLRNYRLDYLKGFCRGLGAAFLQAKRDSENVEQVQALMVVKEALVKVAIPDFFPELGKPRKYGEIRNQQAHNQGYDDGKAHANRRSLEG